MTHKKLLIGAFLFAAAAVARANVIVDWNLITVRATKIGGMNSNLASRLEAIEAIAVYDAVNSIHPLGTPYHFAGVADVGASLPAAIAGAAHQVLVHYFPNQAGWLDSAFASALADIPVKGKSAGLTIGVASANDIIQLRVSDGGDPDVGYPGPVAPGVGAYRPTPAGFKPGINQQWGHVKPFVLDSGNQFRPEPPPAINSKAYRDALAEVAAIGATNSTSRTEDQTHIAQFYKQDAELTVNEAARLLVASHRSSLETSALIFVLTDIAEADARIAIWDAKYFYLFWRPVTALNADENGAVTNDYKKWTPLISTPPHPSYPCGHCGTVTAGFEILKTFYGDTNTITLHTTTPGEPARTLHSLKEGELENGFSRDYGGIHYTFDLTSSVRLGKKVSDYTLAKGPHAKK